MFLHVSHISVVDTNKKLSLMFLEIFGCACAGSDMWHLAIPYVPNTSQVIGDLEPGLTYQFRVSANNAIGISQPSLPSAYVAVPSEYGDLCFNLFFKF